MISHASKYPMIITRDINQCVLDNYNSQKTEEYMKNTIGCETPEGQQAFRAGMVYAALLLSTECYQFGDIDITEDDFQGYAKFLEEATK